MPFTISKLRSTSSSYNKSISQEHADIRYLNQNFQETLLFNVDLNNHRIINLADPINESDVVSRKYITAINTQLDTHNIRLGNHDQGLTSLYNGMALASTNGVNFFAARFYREPEPSNF